MRDFCRAIAPHPRYSKVKEGFTRHLICQIGEDDSSDLLALTVLSLVDCQWPGTDGEPPVERYTFSVNEKANGETFDMERLLPKLAEWRSRQLTDPVAASAFDFLASDYSLDTSVLPPPE